MSKLKATDLIYFHFDLFFSFLFLELKVRVRMMRSHYYTSFTSDDIVTSHKTYRRT